MADARATRLIAEALSAAKDSRATQIVVEAIDATTADARSTQIVVEVLSIPFAGTSEGVASVTGTLDVPYTPGELTGTIAGSASVTVEDNATVRSAQTDLQVASQADSDVRSAQASLLAASQADSAVRSAQTTLLASYIYINAIEATPSGGSSVVASLLVFAPGELDGESDGTSTVTGTLSTIKELSGTISGSASVLGATIAVPSIAGPIPYQVGFGGKLAYELHSPIAGSSTVTGTLSVDVQLSGTVAGVAQVSAQLGNIDVLQGGTSDGSSTVVGFLQVLVNDAGELVNEMAGTSDGSSTVLVTGFIAGSGTGPVVPVHGDEYLYLQVNSGFGFEDIDDVSSRPDFVSQTYPDGHTELDFDRYLYHQVNVGFGFEDIDDASLLTGFVSQTYPDGHTELDFDRYLYQQIQVIEGIGAQEGRLTVRPGKSDNESYVPSPEPPSGVFS